MNKPAYLSVIIPAYNEEKTISTTLKSVNEYLKNQDYSYEIIVNTDGSTDRTDDVVKNMMKEMPYLRLISSEVNMGKGYGVRISMLRANGEYRLFMDADNATTIEQVEKMWPEFENGFDIVIGSRDVKGADIVVAQPWHRILLGNTFNLIVQTIGGLRGIKDTQCGFKAFKSEVVVDVFKKCQINRWAFDVEILVVAKKFGYKVKEVPVKWVNNPNSRVKLKGMIRMLFEVIEIRLNLIKGVYKK